MTAKPTAAGAKVLVQLLAAQTTGQHTTPAASLNGKVLDRLVADGHVELLVRLSPEGLTAAHDAAHPGPEPA